MSTENIKVIITIKHLSGPRKGQLEKQVRSYAEADKLRVGDLRSELVGDDRMIDLWEIVEIEHTNTIILTERQALAASRSLEEGYRFSEDDYYRARSDWGRSSAMDSVAIYKSLINRISGKLGFRPKGVTSSGESGFDFDLTARELTKLQFALQLFTPSGFKATDRDHLNGYLSAAHYEIYLALRGEAV